METRAVNVRWQEYDTYIGRPGKYVEGYFGNPFVVGVDGDREAVLSMFKPWFLNRVTYDLDYRAAVLKLKGQRLGCFCKPQACHGDVIAEWVEANAGA